jgi:hypothetical protein
MKKLYIILLFSVGFSAACSAQFEGLYQFTHSYFRSDPFLGQFSGFMQHLTSDQAITLKETKLRTDSSLYSFIGIYDKYNPFFFKPGKVQVMLKETPVQYSDSLPSADTILLYQLTAFAEISDKGRKEVQTEFEKIHRNYKRRFFDFNFSEFKDDNEKVIGAMHNYFVPMHGLAPVTVAWGVVEKTQQPVLTLTLRLKTSSNLAALPVPLYNP